MLKLYVATSIFPYTFQEASPDLVNQSTCQHACRRLRFPSKVSVARLSLERESLVHALPLTDVFRQPEWAMFTSCRCYHDDTSKLSLSQSHYRHSACSSCSRGNVNYAGAYLLYCPAGWQAGVWLHTRLPSSPTTIYILSQELHADLPARQFKLMPRSGMPLCR